MRKSLIFAIPVMMAGAAHAGTLELTVELPKLNVAEYHRPYVAIWIEDASGKVAANLSVWYGTGMKDNEGEKWLKDIRQWWRRTGRSLDLPIDGVSSPTKPPGKNTIKFDTAKGPIAALPPGDYKIVVEAAREVGEKELVEIPFKWAPGADTSGAAAGKQELGAITLKITT